MLASNQPNPLIEMTKSLIENFNSSDNVMTQSLDPVILNNNNTNLIQEHVTPMKQQNLNHLPCSANLYNGKQFNCIFYTLSF